MFSSWVKTTTFVCLRQLGFGPQHVLLTGRDEGIIVQGSGQSWTLDLPRESHGVAAGHPARQISACRMDKLACASVNCGLSKPPDKLVVFLPRWV